MPVLKPTLRNTAERNAIVEANQPLVTFVAERFLPCRIDFDDLVAAGQFGLIRAAELWDPSVGKFSTCAFRHIFQAMRVAVWQYSGAITVPRSAHEAHRGYYKGMRASSVAAAGRAIKAKRVSLSDHEQANAIELATANQGTGNADNRDEIESLLGRIPKLEARVLRLRFGLDDGHELSRAEVGRIIGKNREWIRQLEVRGLAQLRELATG